MLLTIAIVCIILILVFIFGVFILIYNRFQSFKDEIFDLKKSNSEKTGVRNILRPKQTILYILLTLLPVNNKLFRKLLLKIISPQKKENIY